MNRRGRARAIAFTRAWLAPVDELDAAAVERAADRLSAFIASLPAANGRLMRAVFDGLSLLPGDPLAWGARLDAVRERLGARASVPSFLSMARGIRSLLAIALYDDPEVARSIGYRHPATRGGAADPTPVAPDPIAIARKRIEGADVPARALFANDGRPRIAVIGSGAGGAVVAARLAHRFDVAVFEAGPAFRPSEFPLDTMSGISLLYEQALQTYTRDLDLQILRGRLVGGSTVLSSGMSVRPRSRTLAAWQAAGISQSAIHAALAAVEARLRIEPLDAAITTDPGRLWRAGGEALGEDLIFETPRVNVAMHPHQHRGSTWERSAPSCVGCGACNYGCRYGHKLSMDVTYLRDLVARGGKVHAGLPVARVRMCDGVAQAIELARGGAPVPVDAVVVAAGAIGSPALVGRSLRNAPQVGRGLGFNYGTPVIARFPTAPARPGQYGIQINYIASKPSDERFVLENAFLPAALMATLLPPNPIEHRRWMRAYDRLAMVVNTIGSPQRGSVDGQERVDYRFDDEDMRVVRESLALTVRSLLRAGAEEVRLAGGRDLFTQGDSPAVITDRLRRSAATPSQLMLMSAHPQGGLRLDRDPERGAVDEDFAVHGTANLFVADASVFPSTLVVNPQWTVMAVAEAAAHRIERRLSMPRRTRSIVFESTPDAAGAPDGIG